MRKTARVNTHGQRLQLISLLVIGFGLALPAYALDTIVSGIVLEKGTRKPLQGVFVSAKENPSLSAITDISGRFALTLPVPGDYLLSAASFGAENPETISVRVTQDSQGTPVIQPDALMFYVAAATVLPEVLVRGERSPDRVSKSIITGSELRQIPGSGGDPLVSLQSMPGVVSTNGSSAQPAVRGSGPEDNAYYVDGLIVGKLFHFGSISVFNADLIDDFNLYSAAFSPHYYNVIGAVLDVSLREPRNDRLGGKVNVNLLGSDFLVEGPSSKNQSFYFAARRSYVDLFVKQVENKGVTLQIPNYWDYQGKYLWKPNATDRVTLHLQGAADKLKLNIGGNSDIAKQQPILAGDFTLSDTYSTQAIVWDANVRGDIYNQLALQHMAHPVKSSVGSASSIYLDQEAERLQEKIRIPFSSDHELSLASSLIRSRTSVEVDSQKLSCTQFNPNCDLTSAPRAQLSDRIDATVWDVSAQDRKKVLPALTLIGGVRHSSENYLKKMYTEPRLGVEWEWSKNTLLTAGWGKHNQLPAGPQISPKFGNPSLEHLRAEHSVLGISQKLEDDWSWKAEAYYKKLSNIIVNDPVLNYTNSGSGKAYGTELLIKKDASERFSGWLSLSLARSERRNDVTGEVFRYAYDQPVNTTLVTTYKISREWSFGAKWNYHSGAPYTPILGTSGFYPDGRPKPVYAEVNSGKLPPYHRLDLRVDRNFIFNTWKMNAYFELNNAYQRTNVIDYSYDPGYTKKDPVTPFVLPISFGVQAEF